jgi:hypothetical protein
MGWNTINDEKVNFVHPLVCFSNGYGDWVRSCFSTSFNICSANVYATAWIADIYACAHCCHNGNTAILGIVHKPGVGIFIGASHCLGDIGEWHRICFYWQAGVLVGK